MAALQAKQYLSGMMIVLLLAAVQASDAGVSNRANDDGIRPGKSHPQYWQYKGREVLLLGGSNNDNIFQSADLVEQLDLLQAAGGNYIRNTMSGRDSGNVWPFRLREDGKFNLNKWNDEYWNRFANFLQQTAERDIIVQIELWATFDYYRDNWARNPFNPKNNVNYNPQRSKLTEVVDTHPIFADNNFFRSVPSKLNITPVLWQQQRFIDKILSYSLQYDHVLYCMDNETSVTSDWGKFWARYVRKKAKLLGKTAQTTEMWDAWELSHATHHETYDNPDIFTFVDISQNNHQSGQKHWDNGLGVIKYLKAMGYLRPVNNVKIYGNDGGRHKTTRDGIEAFCRNVFFGAAAARFHRPTSGQGINETAQKVIKSMRMLSDNMDFFNGEPRNDLLSDREDNEAYCRAIPGKEYAVFFTDGGEVKLDVQAVSGRVRVKWMNILDAAWLPERTVKANEKLTLTCPDKGYWVVLVKEK